MKNAIAVLSVLLLLAGCSSKAADTPESGGHEGYVTFVQGGKSGYTICAPSTLGSNLRLFSVAIQKATGAALDTKTASSNATDLEIILGSSKARTESIEALGDITSGYVIKVVGKKLIIAGSDETWTVLAMEAFAKSCLSNPEYCHDGTLELPGNYSETRKDADPQFIASFLKSGRKFTLQATLVGTVPQKGTYTVAQGAASDGKHVYFTMKGGEDSNHDSHCIVYKYTLSPFEQVAFSEDFNGHHANDMAFDTKNKRVLVVNGTGASSQLTALDAETLEVSTIKTSLGIGGMTYNPKRNVYGITQGGKKYQIADENFVTTKDFGRSDGMVNTYTAQGMGSDDSYVYFPMSPKSGGGTDNILCTYDWEGKHVADLHIDLNMESESMFYAGGRYYVNFYSSGARLYQITPIIVFAP